MERRTEILEEALARHRAGQLSDAEALYRTLLNADPRDAEALHLLGVAADARGHHVQAAELVTQALDIRSSPRFHCNLGMIRLHLGQAESARAECMRALQLRPDYPEALNNLGAALEALGLPRDAAAAFQKAATLRPEHAEYWCNLGNMLWLLRRKEEAEAAYAKAVALAPEWPHIRARLGHALRADGRLPEAEAAFRRQVALAPDDPEAKQNLAVTLGEQGHVTEAAELFPQAIALAPQNPEGYVNLATALRQLRRFDEAEAACRRAIALRPDHSGALANLGNILRETGRLAEAEATLRRAVALRPALVGSYNDLAIILIDQARLLEALAVLDLAQALDSDDADTSHHRAFVLLLLGRFLPGWDAYEVRFATRQGKADQRHFSQPRWNGERLEGKTIFLHAEQGLGDILQFCRYAPLIAAAGGKVILETPGPLRRLLSSLPGVTALVSQGELPPPFDYYLPLLSLPRMFATTRGTIPATVPYLSPPKEAIAAWRKRLGRARAGIKRAGIVWAGNPHHINDSRRSIPFSALAPLWLVEGVRWFSLQLGPGTESLALAPEEGVIDLSPHLTDFVETAAALRLLDVVVTVDTAVAHLAGALGVPALIMLPFAPDWRWMLESQETPWYPSLRLIRQDEQRDWGTVIAQVIRHLIGDNK